MKRTTITEKFDAAGKLIERVTVTEDSADPVVLPAPIPNVYPYPNIPPNTWQSPAPMGGCSACALSGICNCLKPPGVAPIMCSVN